MTGSALRDAGMARAVEAQDAAIPAWSDRAYLALLALALHQPTLHVDDLLGHDLPEPSHPNAWGVVWMRAIRAGIIEHSGSVKRSTAPRKHAHNYPVYRSLVFGHRETAE